MAEVTLDFETYYDDKCSLRKLTYLEYINHEKFKVLSVGIAVGDQPTVYIEYPTRDDIAQYLSPGDELICHNTMFDAIILSQVFELHGFVYRDTLSMARAIWPQFSNQLGSIARRLWPDDESLRKLDDIENTKGKYLEDLTKEEREGFGRYCIRDVDLTRNIWGLFKTFYPQDELLLIHKTIRNFVEPNLTVNKSDIETFKVQTATERRKLIEKSGLSETVLSSNQKFADWLRDQDIEPPMKTSVTTGKPTLALAKNDLEFMDLQLEYPEFKDVWEARKRVKSTIDLSRADRLINAAVASLDGATALLPAPLSYYGAHTGRFSGTQKINLQNLRRGSPLRVAIEAPENWLLYVSDLSNIEARMLAWLAGQTDLVEDFRNGVDLYSKFASRVFGYPVNRKAKDEHGNKPHEMEGNVGKTAVLGLGYGMGAPKFKDTLAKGPMGADPIKVSQEFAYQTVQMYRSTYPAITQLWRTAESWLYTMCQSGLSDTYGPLKIEYQRIVLPNGMTLSYPGLDYSEDPHTGRYSFHYYGGKGKEKKYLYGGLVVENITQALARIVITDQWHGIDTYLAEHYDTDTARVILQVHDELIACAPDSDKDQTMETIYNIMRIPPRWCADLPLDCEGGYDRGYSK